MKYICIEPKCIKQVSHKNSRCRKCAEKYKIYPSRKDKDNPSYIDGRSTEKHYCKCGKEITWYSAINGSGMCRSCSCKERYKDPKNHPMFGKKRPEHSERMKGKKNFFYVHGQYMELYPSGWTRDYKDQIRKRDNHTCQLCGVKQEDYYRKLDCHHIDYDKKNINEDNLLSLCHSCHMKTNGNRKYWENKLNK